MVHWDLGPTLETQQIRCWVPARSQLRTHLGWDVEFRTRKLQWPTNFRSSKQKRFH